MAEVCRKAWHLLGRFVFDGGNTAAGVQAAIDAWLLPRVGAAEDLPRVRDALLLDLARKAVAGGARLEAAAFFADHRLDATPLSEWRALTAKARAHLEGVQRRWEYRPDEDARPSLAGDVAGHWTDACPTLVLAGESGRGKTWLGFALLARAAARQEVALFVEATGNPREDLACAQSTFWNAIVGQEGPSPTFDRIRARLGQLQGVVNAGRRFCLLVDGVAATEEARRLVREPWEEWGVRLVITCTPEVAQAARAAAPGRAAILPVPDWTVGELHAYLEAHVGDGGEAIPADVRATLRRPLLARLYRGLATGAWRPTNEYDLYARHWEKQFGAHTGHPLDVVGVHRLARAVLGGAPYPWSGGQLQAAGVGEETLNRLLRSGWLRCPAADRYEAWHDRGLNWAAAEALAAQMQAAPEQTEGLIHEAARQFDLPTPNGGRPLPYLPMDVLWVLLHAPEPRLQSLVGPVIQALERAAGGRRQDVLYGHLLPTLGSAVLPHLAGRLEAAAVEGDLHRLGLAAHAVAAFGGDGAHAAADRLLGDDRPRVRRAAARVFTACPSGEALDRLWQLHCAGQTDPAAFALHAREGAVHVYEDTFAALRACVRRAPAWLERAIGQADPGREPVHDLAYLVAGLGDDDLWRRTKGALMRKVAPGRQRSLALNVLRYRDADELGWLVERIHREDDLVGPVALQALARIDAAEALRQLDRLPERALYLTRRGGLGELLARLPEPTRARLLDRLRAHPDPFGLAVVFQDQEDAMDGPILEFLLDAAAAHFAGELARPSPPGRVGFVTRPLGLLLPLSRPALLERLRRRRGLPLERNLTAWLLQQGPQQGDIQERYKHNGLGVLKKVGGPGLTAVVNRWLAVGDGYARMIAPELAPRCADGETLGHLARISLEDSQGQGAAVHQGYAALALAETDCWRDVIAFVVRWGLLTLAQVADRFGAAGRLDDAAMAPALAALEGVGEPPPGAILALGLGGRTEQLGRIRATLDAAAPESPLAQACLQALGRLGDDSPAAVPALVRQVAVEPHRCDALRALLCNRSEAARTALLHQLGRFYWHGVAVALLAEPGSARQALPLVRRRLQEAAPQARLEQLEPLLSLPDPLILDELLDTAGFHDFIREAAFADDGGLLALGMREVAIRCLARFDPAAAFQAARRELRRAGGPERERYPHLLVALDRDQALPLLLDLAVEEAAVAHCWALGRALAAAGGCDLIRPWFSSAESTRRRAACRLAGRLPPDPWILDALRQRLDDGDRQVARAAARAFRLQEAAVTAQELAAALRAEADCAHRWAILDALIVVADPGDVGQPAPEWARAVAGGLTPAMAARLSRELERRRQAVLEEGRRQDDGE